MCNHDLRTSPETLRVSTLNGSAPGVPALNDSASTGSILDELAPGGSLGNDSTGNNSAPTPPALHVRVSSDGANLVVNVSGELDVRTRELVEKACLTGHDVAVVVDISELTFMDCCGYAGLIAIGRALREKGGSLTLRNESGQPARLLALLRAAESMREVGTTA